MTRSGKFHLICNSPNLFPLKWLRMTQNGQFCPIYNFCNLSPPKWLRMTRNCEFHPICNFSNVFQLKWLRMTRNGQFCTICNFSNLFRLKWPRMTWNGQFHLIRNFSNLFPLKLPRMTWNGQFCMAKIKCTVIQGNFYERLPFYMDSCALSPMASLLPIKFANFLLGVGYYVFDKQKTNLKDLDLKTSIPNIIYRILKAGIGSIREGAKNPINTIK